MFQDSPTSEIYVRRYEIISQLNKGARTKVTFVSAPIGYGKTTVVQMWMNTVDQTATHLYTILPGDTLPPFDDNGKHILIVEDFHAYDETDTQHIIAYIKDSPAQFCFVLVSRGELPYDLKAYAAVRQLCLITETHLAFDAQEVGELLAIYDIRLTDKEVREMTTLSGGHILMLNALICALESNKRLWHKSLCDAARDNVFVILDAELWSGFDKRTRAFLSRLSLFETLPRGIIPVVTGQADAEPLLENLTQVSGFAIRLPDTGYEFRLLFREYFMHKAQTVLSDSERTSTLDMYRKTHVSRYRAAVAVEFAPCENHRKRSRANVVGRAENAKHGSYKQSPEFAVGRQGFL